MPSQVMPGRQHPAAPQNGSTIRRRLIVVAATLTFALVLTSTVLAAADAAGSGAPAPALSLVAPVQPQAFLQIAVNYAHEWVAGSTDAGATVAVTVTDGTGTPKADAVVAVDGGEFFVGCDDWSSGQCPDIQTGDSVYAESAGMLADIDPVGAISGKLDAVENTVVGTLQAEWLPNPSEVQCEVWIDSGPEPITATVHPGGGTFTCDFDSVWDLEPPQVVAVRYFEPDGDSVINVLDWPHMQVNYAHDWVGGNYELGHTVWLTVTESDGSTVKGTAAIDSVSGGGWGGDGFQTTPEHWSSQVPDIVPGDWVHFSTDDGYTKTIEVGTISGTLDLAADSVTGPIYASFAQTLPVQCHPWGAWNAGMGDVPVQESEATPNGSVPFDCSWAGEWDIVPGQDVAVLYVEPDGDMVIDVYRGPAPYLRMEKWAQGQPGEGGNMRFTLRYWNEGDAPAENVVLTDTLQGMAYLGDTSGLSSSGSGPGPIVWDVGTVDPGTDVQFDVFVAVTSVGPDTITNTVEIATSNPFDQGEPEEKIAQWTAEVVPNETHLNVGKWAWTNDPAPDTDVIFTVNVCNNGPTGSSEVTLTDLLHPVLALTDWWAQSPGWYEVPGDPGELIFALPSLPGGSCSEVYLRAYVPPDVAPGDYLSNTALITATNDLEPEDNEAFWEGNANGPRLNLYVSKWWNSGQLVPGGELRYGIGYGNDGNVPVAPFVITDTFPVSTTFVGAWHSDPWGGYEFPPQILTDEYAVWEIPGLENGFGGDFEVVLAVDPDASPGELVNTVDITPLPGEDTYQDNRAEWAETLYTPGDPNLRVHKWHRWDGDGHLSYQVLFENIGTEPVGDVWITDTLPLGTQWDGWWDLGFEWDRLVTWDHIQGARTFIWLFSELYPGEAGWLYFGANLDEPGAPVRWYTNTVEIAVPSGDPNEGDNTYEEVAFSGGEVRRAELWLNQTGPSSMWGEALLGVVVTVTTPHTQVLAWADPGCGGCWGIDDVGPLSPGDLVEVVAGEGLMPISITIPDPLDVAVDTAADEVYGQIGGWSARPLQVHGDWPGGYQEVLSDGDGNFLASYPEVPPGASGYIRFVDEINYAEVVFHRPFWALDLVLNVNYGHDAVEGHYEPGHTVWITVTESDRSTVKGTAELPTGGLPDWEQPGFSTHWGGWLGNQPDLLPGDWVFGRVDNGYEAEVQIGEIALTVDGTADTVSGVLNVGGPSDPLYTRAEVWGPFEAPALDDMVSPAGGSFWFDFGAAGWDLGPGQTVAVMYWEPDGDRVINVFDWPHITAHIGPASDGNRRVWGHRAGADATVTVTVSTSLGGFVASTVTTADAWGQYDTLDGLPEGALATWNEVTVDVGNDITDVLTIYPMGGEADPDTDVVTVTAAGPPTFRVNLQYCDPGGCDWIDLGEIGESGVIAVDLMAERGFDVRLGTSFDAELRVSNDHIVRYSWFLPAPELGVWKWNPGGHARPGGVYVYGIQYRNDGTGPAEDAVIVDALPPLTTYADDTAGLPVTVGPGGVITWTLDTLDPGQGGFFMVTLDVDPAVLTGTATLDPNCVAITTTSAGDWNPGNDSACADPLDVWEDDVELGIDKWPVPADPMPGQEFEYTLQWCNNRGAAAGPVVLTDTLPDGTTFLDWWPQDPNEPFWVEFSSDPGELVLGAPGLPGNRCGELYLRLLLDPGAEISTTLVNTVVIEVADDVDPENNSRVRDDTHISPPRYDLGIHKDINASVLVPGGYVGFSLDYYNSGNIATPVTLTDTVPTGLHYVSAHWADDVPDEVGPLPEPTISGDQVIWELPELPVNRGHGLNVLFGIDDGIETGVEFGNCVTISGAGPEDNPEDNSDCFPFTVQSSGPNLSVHKWHEWHGEGQLGYRVRFDNFGDQPVGDVWITDTLPLGTQWDGWWNMDYDWSRLADFAGAPGVLTWHLSEVRPGETGWLYFNANLDQPGEPARWYTNTVEIVGPPGDQNPDDNLHEDVAYSGGEVRRVEFSLNPAGANTVWGDAHPSSLVTVTTPYTQIVTSTAPDRGWSIDPVGELYPGDVVTVTAYTGIVPVVVTIPDPLEAAVDTAADEVYGQIGGWEERPVEVHGNWPEGYRQVLSEPDGSFLASYPDAPRGASGYIRFSDQIGDAEVVFHRLFWSLDLLLTADYGHDWVGAEYEGGHTIYLTVTNDVGAVKATTLVDTPPGRGWWSTEPGQWSPQQPDIVPGDWVYGLVDGGTYTTEVHVGTIDAEVDVDSDIVSGTLDIQWLTLPVLVSCEIHEENGVGVSIPGVNPKGGTFLCDFSTGPQPWDIVPGQNVAVNYTEPDGDRVQAHPANPAPHLRVEKWSDGQPAEGGNMAFTVRYRNEGDLPAENVVLTDTLEGLAYLGDTSGLPVSGSDPIVWDVGLLEPGDWVQFTVYVQVTASAPQLVTNTLQIATSNPYDQGDPGEKVAQWAREVVPNDTYLHVSKWAWTPNPAPDTDVVFQIGVCNDGSTASDEVLLTDTVHPSMTVGTWWAQELGWQETYSDTGHLELAHPSIASFQCSQVYLRVHLDADAWPGMPITNTALIYSDSDLDGQNEALWEGGVGEPVPNLYTYKSWANGQLVPGGELHYNVQVGNDGNLPIGETILVTDTLPAHTVFESLWLHDQVGRHPVTPVLVGPDRVLWEIAGLDNGYWLHFELVLNVDGDAPVGAVLTNTVEISCLPGEGCGDNSSTWVETLYDYGPNLRVRKTGSWNDWGQDTRRASYWVNIENVGDEIVYDVAVTDSYPEAMLLDGGIDTEWWRVTNWGHEPAGHYLTATYAYLGAGESTWLNFAAIVPGTDPVTRGLILTNTIEVASVPGEPTYDDNVDIAVLTTGPDLFVEKNWVAGELVPGELITYSLVFGNDRLGHEWWWGMQGDAWLTDTLPAHTAFVTATLHWCGDTSWCAVEPTVDEGDRLAWQLRPLGAAERNEIQVTLRVSETIQAYDLLTNTVEIASDQPISDADPYLGNNVAEHVAMAVLPRFEVGKAYASSRAAGAAVTYTLSVTNTGNGVGTNVVLSDVLPNGLTYGGSDGTFDGTAIRWEIPSIAAEGGLASGWFSATLGCALAPVANDGYRVVDSDQGIVSLPGPEVAFDLVEPSISLALTHTVGHIVAGETIYVTGSATTDGSALSYTWDWGEGPVVGGLTASHAYAWDGSYTVVLTATDTCGYSDAVSAKIDVAAPDLVPSFDYYPVPAHVMVEWPVVFTDTTTTDGPAIVAWHWDFGDGEMDSGASVSHAYLEAGTYTVTLTVTDALGYSAQHAAPGLVIVSDCVPLSGVSLSYAPPVPLVNVPLVLTATIAPLDATGPITYQWDFGDAIAEMTTVPSVAHTYAASGLVEVSVTATNRCTLTGVRDQESIIISPWRIYLPLVLRNH